MLPNISRYFHEGDAEIIGLEQQTTNFEIEKQKFFVNYAWSEFYTYKLNCGIKVNQPQIYNSVRAISYFKMAKLLGLERLVPNTHFIKAVFNQDIKIGVYMESAKGIPFLEIMNRKRAELFQPILQKELLDLNLLDVICFEKDHRPDNYNVLFDQDEKVYSISVFDNDSPMSFFTSSNIYFETYDGCSQLIKKNGNINRPFLSEYTCYKILQLNVELLKSTFDGLLTKLQIKYLIKRVAKLQKAIKTSLERNACVLLKDDDWNEFTVEKELNGNYGLTYLGLFASDWKNTTL